MSSQSSERLLQNADKIMKCWEVRALKEVGAAVHQGSLALRDSLPEFLTLLADALSKTVDRTDARVKADRLENERVSRKHGRERASSFNYTMDQLIFEYHILRQVICDVMEEESVLTPPDREVIVSAIEQAVNDAATQFGESLRDIQERLTYTMAHDLRNPITAAKASAELILRQPGDVEHCIKTASRIVNCMDRLNSMIRDLLDASRVRAGQPLPLILDRCDLDFIARQVADEANFIHGNRFLVKSTGKCIGYWCHDAIRRVLENLTTNAAKFSTPTTPITITIEQSEETATLLVHNEGKPIPPEDQATLFQQFRRVRSTRPETGWGLGLTVVKGITEAHCGSVHVESANVKGTTFKIVLPKDSRG